jgi:hypothetical protein
MRHPMLMWADADAASGDESDFQAWAEFDAQVKTAGAFVLNGALAPAAPGARVGGAGHMSEHARGSSPAKPEVPRRSSSGQSMRGAREAGRATGHYVPLSFIYSGHLQNAT